MNLELAKKFEGHHGITKITTMHHGEVFVLLCLEKGRFLTQTEKADKFRCKSPGSMWDSRKCIII
jgi:hypothetical protein